MANWETDFNLALDFINEQGGDDLRSEDNSNSLPDLEIQSRLPTVVPSDINESDEDETDSDENADRRFYRQRTTGNHGHLRLWEFILNLLNNPKYNKTHIVWIDRENGVFRIIRKTEIARMWGEIKNNNRMTYQNMSRAMRYYYRFKIMEPVIGRRLVYKFGSNAYGWQPT